MHKSLFMGQIHDESMLTPEERIFREYITRGDDFCKIELYRQAVNWYRQAVELRPESEEARSRLLDCRSKIKKESRTILIILAVAAMVVLAGILFS